MRKLALLAVCVAGPALAGETLLGVAFAEGKSLGRIFVSDGGTVSNVTTGYDTPCESTSCDKAFPIPTTSKITTQCDVAVYYDSAECAVDGGHGTRLTADQLYPDSTGSSIVCRRADGGSYSGGVVAIRPISGATARCIVKPRRGTE